MVDIAGGGCAALEGAAEGWRGGFRVGTISLRAKVGVLMVVTNVNISRSEPYISCGE